MNYLVIYLTVLFMLLFRISWVYHERKPHAEYVAGIVMSIAWPVLLAVALVVLPFWLVLALGRKCRMYAEDAKAKRFSRLMAAQMDASEGAAAHGGSSDRNESTWHPVARRPNGQRYSQPDAVGDEPV